MIRLGFDPVLEAQQMHQELIKEAEQYRLVNEALGADATRAAFGYKLLAFVGSKIVSLGTSLEKRYGASTQTEVDLLSQASAEGCR